MSDEKEYKLQDILSEYSDGVPETPPPTVLKRPAGAELFEWLQMVLICVVGAVISEWLGGFGGLGVYMTRVKKAFAFDKMFAVIFLISGISLALMALVEFAEKKAMPYRHLDKQ